jgi:hypothetical protein
MNLRALVFFFLSATCFLWSETPAAQSATPALGPVIMVAEGQSPQGFPYMHGGVGLDERESMEQRGKSYNVKFSFADKRGPYIAGVKVMLEGENRKEIVNIVSDGPLFYIQLPPGTYNLKATFGPKTNEVKALKVFKDKKINQTLIWDLGAEADQVTVR